jgi:hypothetical protein
VTQYEVELLMGVEAAIGLKLGEFEFKEEEVSAFLGEANAARRVAELWWQEGGHQEKNEKRKQESRTKRRKKQT